MVVEIKNVDIQEDEIVIEGVSLETILTSDDLFEAMDETIHQFRFQKANPQARKYLYKVCTSQKKCKNKKSLGEMIEELPGLILSLSDNFQG